MADDRCTWTPPGGLFTPALERRSGNPKLISTYRAPQREYLKRSKPALNQTPRPESRMRKRQSERYLATVDSPRARLVELAAAAAYVH